MPKVLIADKLSPRAVEILDAAYRSAASGELEEVRR